MHFQLATIACVSVVGSLAAKLIPRDALRPGLGYPEPSKRSLPDQLLTRRALEDRGRLQRRGFANFCAGGKCFGMGKNAVKEEEQLAENVRQRSDWSHRKHGKKTGTGESESHESQHGSISSDKSESHEPQHGSSPSGKKKKGPGLTTSPFEGGVAGKKTGAAFESGVGHEHAGFTALGEKTVRPGPRKIEKFSHEKGSSLSHEHGHSPSKDVFGGQQPPKSLRVTDAFGSVGPRQKSQHALGGPRDDPHGGTARIGPDILDVDPLDKILKPPKNDARHGTMGSRSQSAKHLDFTSQGSAH